MNPKPEPKLVTPGVIAANVGEPIHRVLHVLATRQHIRPAARGGTLRLYRRDAIAMVRHELTAIDARRHARRGWPMPIDPTTPPAPLLVSDREAARLLGGISIRTLYTMRRRSEIQAVRIGSRVLYDVAELRAFIERSKGVGA